MVENDRIKQALDYIKDNIVVSQEIDNTVYGLLLWSEKLDRLIEILGGDVEYVYNSCKR